MAREAGYGEAMSDLHAPALERFAALVAAETETLRAALDAAVAWAAPMADAPKSSRPAWFDQARSALSHKGPIL
jgi:hypothetical protein